MPNLNITKPELIWPGKYDESGKRIVNRGAALPFQIIETIREGRATRAAGGPDLFAFASQKNDSEDSDKWHNKLIWGDNLLVMSSLLQQYAGKIDLIYIDPPFATGADFSFTAEVGEEDSVDVIKQQSSIEEKAYRDTWGRGLESYLTVLSDRLMLMRDLLSPTGSLYVHLGWQVSCHIKLLLDEIFGETMFQNEIVWKRQTAKGGAFDGIGQYGRIHETIWFYTKTDQYKWNTQYTEYDQKHIDQSYKNIEEKTGRRFSLRDLTAAGSRSGDSGREIVIKGEKIFPPRGRHWAVGLKPGETVQQAVDRLLEADKLWYSNGKMPRLKLYLDEMPGVPLQSIWTDVLSVQAQSMERLDYATQKPESLLERIIKASSNEGDIVADFFCGSGTTLATAEKLGRRWIGADLGRFAIHTTRKRLLGVPECKPFQILNLGQYERKYWQGVMFGKPDASPEAALVAEYVRFILELYQAQPCPGFRHIHGRKGRVLVAVGAVDAPVTITQVNEAVTECAAAGQKELHILGWEWEMGMNDPIIKQAKASHGVTLRLMTIPREVMEKRAVECGDIRFFDVAYLKAGVEPQDKAKRKVKVELKNFAIPDTDLIPEEVRQKITKWSDYIDYWAIDWDYRRDTFMNQWQTYRTRTDRKLALVSSEHDYKAAGKYEILVKVVDIFGNDTSLLLEWKAK